VPKSDPKSDTCGGGAQFVSLSTRPAVRLCAAEERLLRPKDVFKECEECPEMVVVPAGSFTMGSPAGEPGALALEGPQHAVTISKAFAVGKFHVTVDQFAAFVGETQYDAGSTCRTFEGGKFDDRDGRSWRNPGFPQAGAHPVVCMNWNDAKAYVEWLSNKTGRPYRLLSEAEWEYAARARTEPGSYPRLWFGNDEKDLCRYGNVADQKARDSIEGAKGWTVAPCNDGYAYTSPVGSFAPNGFGLNDMMGNAWQWTEDCYHDSPPFQGRVGYKDAPSNGSAWTTGDCQIGRVFRGGSWYHNTQLLRAGSRGAFPAQPRLHHAGFRVARTVN
jgi:formylglycine-generating enzyme required for sulfatase activity